MQNQNSYFMGSKRFRAVSRNRMYTQAQLRPTHCPFWPAAPQHPARSARPPRRRLSSNVVARCISTQARSAAPCEKSHAFLASRSGMPMVQTPRLGPARLPGGLLSSRSCISSLCHGREAKYFTTAVSACPTRRSSLAQLRLPSAGAALHTSCRVPPSCKHSRLQGPGSRT